MLSQWVHCQSFLIFLLYHRGTPDALPPHPIQPPVFLSLSMLVPSVGICCCSSGCWSTRGCIHPSGLYSDHWVWQQLWGLCVSHHHLSVTLLCLTLLSLSAAVSAATGAWAMGSPPGLPHAVNNQAFCSSAQLCVGCLDWCVQDIPSDLFIATPGSLPGAVVLYLGSGMYIWSLRF